MKKIFSIFLLFCITLLSINNINLNKNILPQTEYLGEQDLRTRERPTITSFKANPKKATAHSVFLSWNILNPDNTIQKMELWNSTTNMKIKEVDNINSLSYSERSKLFVVNDYQIIGLETNKSYDFTLIVHWDCYDGYAGTATPWVKTSTAGRDVTFTNFSLESKTSNSAIINIAYNDPDKTVQKIIIHDQNGNMQDVTIYSKDIVNGKYELKNLKQGNYKLYATLILSFGSDVTSPQSVDFSLSQTIPTITSFSANQAQSTTNSVSVNWAIQDSDNIVDSIQIWDSTKNVILKQVNPITLVANNYAITGLSSNTRYNLELRVHWSDSSTGQAGEVKKSTSVSTNAQVPIINDFSLDSTTSNSAIVNIVYSDPDSMVSSITIHDQNGNMEDAVLLPNDIVNNQYELTNLHSRDYQLELTLNESNGGKITSPQIVNFTIDNTIPFITSFSVNQTQSTTNSVSLNWVIQDSSNFVDSIEIWDSTNNVRLKQVESTMLVANNYVIDGLSSNTSYNLELRVHWSDSTNGFSDDIKRSTSVNTNAQIPTIDDFYLVSTTNNSAIIKIKYNDPDNVVDKITIHDKNGNMQDVVFSTSDLVNNEYELKNIKSGDYDLELTLHWASLNDENTIKYNKSLEFTFEKRMSSENIILVSTFSIILLLLLLLLLILLVLYLIKRSQNKQANEDNYYVEGEDYYGEDYYYDENAYYEDENNFYYENSQY